ncbi:hypothetical protein D3C86_1132490 [compost metagenome]
MQAFDETNEHWLAVLRYFWNLQLRVPTINRISEFLIVDHQHEVVRFRCLGFGLSIHQRLSVVEHILDPQFFQQVAGVNLQQPVVDVDELGTSTQTFTVQLGLTWEVLDVPTVGVRVTRRQQCHTDSLGVTPVGVVAVDVGHVDTNVDTLDRTIRRRVERVRVQSERNLVGHLEEIGTVEVEQEPAQFVTHGGIDPLWETEQLDRVRTVHPSSGCPIRNRHVFGDVDRSTVHVLFCRQLVRQRQLDLLPHDGSNEVLQPVQVELGSVDRHDLARTVGVGHHTTSVECVDRHVDSELQQAVVAFRKERRLEVDAGDVTLRRVSGTNERSVHDQQLGDRSHVTHVVVQYRSHDFVVRQLLQGVTNHRRLHRVVDSTWHATVWVVRDLHQLQRNVLPEQRTAVIVHRRDHFGFVADVSTPEDLDARHSRTVHPQARVDSQHVRSNRGIEIHTVGFVLVFVTYAQKDVFVRNLGTRLRWFVLLKLAQTSQQVNGNHLPETSHPVPDFVIDVRDVTPRTGRTGIDFILPPPTVTPVRVCDRDDKRIAHGLNPSVFDGDKVTEVDFTFQV